jgi:hypothetical protein
MRCSRIIESMEDKIDVDNECDQQTQFDAVVQCSKHYAFTFAMYDDFTFGENRDITGCEPPSESIAYKGHSLSNKDIPYLKHVDCIVCGEEIVFTDDEEYQMKKNPPLPCKKDLDYAIKCAEELELENWDYWN